jgi:glucose/arabinose dehydrogenase
MEPFLGNECGVLGIAVDPEFEANGFVYVYVTEIDPSTDQSGLPRVVRFTDVDGVATDRTVIVELPPTNPKVCAHVGGNIHFGPDGYLYLSVGNMERPGTASDLSSPLGKILRVDKVDGGPAPDNPFVDDPDADPRVFAYGLRNPWDFAFHPDTGRLYGPDNGPGNCDELNLLIAGTYYGWPEALPPMNTETCLGLGGADPIYLFSLPDTEPEVFPSNVAPAGVAFVREGVYAQLGTGLLVCEFATRFVRYLEFGGETGDELIRDEVIAKGCRFNVAVDGDGTIFFSFDNGIYRLRPEDILKPSD